MTGEILRTSTLVPGVGKSDQDPFGNAFRDGLDQVERLTGADLGDHGGDLAVVDRVSKGIGARRLPGVDQELQVDGKPLG